MVISITHAKRSEGEEQADDHHRRGITQAEIHHAGNQLLVRFHVERETEVVQPLQNRLVKQQPEKYKEVDYANRQEKNALSGLAVVELTESGKNR